MLRRAQTRACEDEKRTLDASAVTPSTMMRDRDATVPRPLRRRRGRYAAVGEAGGDCGSRENPRMQRWPKGIEVSVRACANVTHVTYATYVAYATYEGTQWGVW